jgi:hypothetical protein
MDVAKREAAKFMKVRAIWQFFEWRRLHLFAPRGSEACEEWLH